MVKAVIIEDNVECVKYLNKILEKFPQIKIVGEPATCIKDSIELINTKKPAMVFLSLGLNDGTNRDGFIALNMAEYRDYHVIIFTAQILEENYKESYKSAFYGTRSVRYIPKLSDDGVLKDAIKYCCSKLSTSRHKDT